MIIIIGIYLTEITRPKTQKSFSFRYGYRYVYLTGPSDWCNPSRFGDWSILTKCRTCLEFSSEIWNYLPYACKLHTLKLWRYLAKSHWTAILNNICFSTRFNQSNNHNVTAKLRKTYSINFTWKRTIAHRDTKTIDLSLWGQVSHICASKITIIVSDTGLSSGRWEAIIWSDLGVD